MTINKKIIKGKKGETVCYTLLNFRFDSSDNKLKWDAFRFYTPVGNQTDDNGFKYFDVPGDGALIERDDTLNKEFMLIVTKDQGAEVVEILEGAETEAIVIGLEGDIVAAGLIPADVAEEITIDYKEVTDAT
jgi:hypothetical protein